MKQVTPAVAEVAINLFHELSKDAHKEEFEGQGPFLIWRGSLLSAFQEVSKTQSYYTLVWNLLKVSNCVSVLSRGARASGSIVVLHAAPTLDDLLEIDPDLLTPERASAKLLLEAQMKDLLVSFRGINVVEALAQMEKRIRSLETQMNNNQGEKTV